MGQVRNRHRELLEAHHKRFHPIWGSILKTGYQNSRFAHQVERFACLYTSHVSNMTFYSPSKSYRYSFCRTIMTNLHPVVVQNAYSGSETIFTHTAGSDGNSVCCSSERSIDLCCNCPFRFSSRFLVLARLDLLSTHVRKNAAQTKKNCADTCKGAKYHGLDSSKHIEINSLDGPKLWMRVVLACRLPCAVLNA